MDTDLTVAFPPDKYDILELAKFETYVPVAPTDSSLYGELLVQIDGDVRLLGNYRQVHGDVKHDRNRLVK